MNLQIRNRNEFISSFLFPISKVDNSSNIRIRNGYLESLIDNSASLFLYARYHLDNSPGECSIILPDTNNLIKSLQLCSEDAITLTIKDNCILYDKFDYKFKYYLFDKNIKKINSEFFKKIKDIKSNSTCFDINKDVIVKIIKLNPLLVESSKLFIFTHNNSVFGKLINNKLQNTNNYEILISEDYKGGFIENGDIILGLDTITLINQSKLYDKINVHINTKHKIVSMACKTENCILNYIISSFVN